MQESHRWFDSTEFIEYKRGRLLVPSLNKELNDEWVVTYSGCYVAWGGSQALINLKMYCTAHGKSNTSYTVVLYIWNFLTALQNYKAGCCPVQLCLWVTSQAHLKVRFIFCIPYPRYQFNSLNRVIYLLFTTPNIVVQYNHIQSSLKIFYGYRKANICKSY